jgi:hypothetical protein
MTSYKFKDTPDVPSDEEIDKHKDFKRLRANYQEVTKPIYKTPLYKNKKVFLALILIVMVAFLIAEFLEEKRNKDKIPAPKALPEAPIPSR